MSRRPRAALPLSVMLLGLTLSAAGAISTTISLSPKAGPPMSAVHVNGSGFGSSETVTLTLDGALVANSVTDPSGAFSATFTIPASETPGAKAVVAEGQISGLTASASFLVRTNWSKRAFDENNSGYNRYENVLTTSNVAGLVKGWSDSTDGVTASSAAIANGTVYVGTPSGLSAFDAAGVRGCSGVPKSCRPLWTAPAGGAVLSSPTIASGDVYVTSVDGKLYAYDSRGLANCSGTPKTCLPLWTSDDLGFWASSPAISGGVLYVGGGGPPAHLYAFDATGVANCSGIPKTCTPLWTGNANLGRSSPFSSPAVSGGRVFIASDTKFGGGFDVYDAHGVTNCSGSPKICDPLWSATISSAGDSSPAVANGEVFIRSTNFALYAFDAAGIQNCSGTPKTCTPLWTAADQDVTSDPVVSDGVVYAGSFAGLEAFDQSGGTNCSGTPKRCDPLWTGDISGSDLDLLQLAGANGVIYGTGIESTFAFDAAGVVNCSGTPTTCQPLWTEASSHQDPVVANGVVFVRASDGSLEAYDLS